MLGNIKFSQFAVGGDVQVSDIVVGLRGGTNTQFTFPGIGLKDASGNYLLQYATVGGAAVNYPLLTNSESGQAVIYGAGGSDTNINVELLPAGSGSIILNTLQWPNNDGTDGQVLATNGSGVLGWITAATVTTPSTVNAVATFSNTVGNLQSSAVKIDSSGDVSNVASVVFNGSTSGTATLLASAVSGTNTLTLPDATGTLATTSQIPTLPVPLSDGGTGADLTASDGGVFYSTASAGAILSGTATANLPLLSGSSTAPTWSSYTLVLGGNLETGGAVSFSGAYSFTGTITGNTTVTFPTSGTLATTSQIPTLPVSLADGGTGADLTASDGGIFYSSASAGAILAGTATADQVLLSGSSTTPAWSTATYPATTTINQLLYSSSANTIVGLASADNGVLVTSSLGVPSIGSTLPTAVQDNITQLGTVTVGTWEGGVIAPAYGGTGVDNGSSTITIGGNFAMSGAYTFTGTLTGNTNVTFPTSGTLLSSTGAVTSITGTSNEITASSSTGAVTLAIAANAVLPGTGGVTLPKGNTAAEAGAAGTVRFNTETTEFEGTADGSTWLPFQSGGTGVTSVSGTSAQIDVSPNTGDVVVSIDSGYVGQTSITTLGTISTGTWESSVVGLAYGGTNADLTASNGGIVYSSASALAILAGTATADQVLLSGSSTTPAWSTATYPATTTVNQLLYSSSANTIAGLATADSGVLITSSGGVPSIGSTLPTAVQTNITELGTITVGSWHGSVIGPTYGGTGVDNGSSTITIGGNFAMSGAYTFTGTLTGNTSVTFPTSGTLLTSANGVSSITGTSNEISASSSTGAVTLSISSNAVLPGSAGVTLPGGNTAARGGGAGTIRLNSQSSVFEGTVDGTNWATFESSSTGVTSVAGTTNQIDVSPTTGNCIVSIDSGYVGQTSITTLGTIGTGTWESSVVGLAYGGTAADLTASDGGIVYSTNSALAILAGTATADQVLLSGSSTTPAWSTATYPATTTVNQLLYSSSANTIVGLATADNGVLITSSAGVPSIGSTLPSAVQGNITSTGTISSGVWNGTVVALAYGGTGADLTASTGGIFYSTISAGAILSGTATAGQLLLSGATAAPAWSTSTYPATNAVNTLLYASSANVMAALATADSSVLVTNSSGVPAWSGAMTNGQVIIGYTSGTPTAATLTAGSNITITNGTGSITIAATLSGGGLTWSNVSGTSQSAAVNSGYIIGNSSQTTVTLPTTCALGSVVAIAGQGTAGWILVPGTLQTIQISQTASSVGALGSVTSANQFDCIEVVCVVANTTWVMTNCVTSGFTIV